MGAGIGHLMSDEAFGPLEDIAMVKLAHLTNDTKEYMHLVQILNLEAALERARKKRESA